MQNWKKILLLSTWNPTIYNIIRWLAGSLGKMTCQPSVWCIIFFIISCKIIFKNLFNLFLIKIKRFECLKSIRNYKRNNAWNIRGLVDQSFVPGNQWTSVLYCRLSDFFYWSMLIFSKVFHKSCPQFSSEKWPLIATIYFLTVFEHYPHNRPVNLHQLF